MVAIRNIDLGNRVVTWDDVNALSRQTTHNWITCTPCVSRSRPGKEQEQIELGEISLILGGLHFLLRVSERAHVGDAQGNPKNNIPLLQWCWPQASYFGNVVLPLVDGILRMLHTWKAKNMLYSCVFTFTAYHRTFQYIPQLLFLPIPMIFTIHHKLGL